MVGFLERMTESQVDVDSGRPIYKGNYLDLLANVERAAKENTLVAGTSFALENER